MGNTSMRRMVSSGLLRRVALVRTDVSEEPDASFIRVTKIDELGTTQAATSNRRTLRRNTNLVFRLLVAACVVPSSPIFVTLMKEAPASSETSVHTRATRCNNPEDTIRHSHRRENLKSYPSMRLHGLLRRWLYLYVDDVRTSQEAHVSKVYYGESVACCFYETSSAFK
jgi:hypothetical protein